jgi:hypothetical protein
MLCYGIHLVALRAACVRVVDDINNDTI